MSRFQKKLIFERINNSHDRESFDSGNASLDYFLKNLSGQFERKNLGRTHVLIEQGKPAIKGYCTLATGAIPFENIPIARKKKVSPHLPVPILLIGKLAVALKEQGKGYATAILREVFRLALNISQSVAIHAVLVSAIAPQAFAFYEHKGFIPLLDQANHLFLPIDIIAKALLD